LPVIPLPPIDPAEFVALLQPLLRTQDAQGIIDLVQSRWTPEQVITLFREENPDVRKVAALVVGLVGKKCCLPKLAPLLKDPDTMVNQMAEHSMWSVWFRSGNPQANHELCRGSKALNRRDYEHALEHFTRAIDLDPTFAEAYNQRAIVHYLREDFDACIGDCEKAVERMPCHFGAWAGLGHCHAHKEQLVDAVRCYEKALKINPHLEGVRQGVEEMRAKLGGEPGE
jgi:tetratricopeptide (TPR) repeat protein